MKVQSYKERPDWRTSHNQEILESLSSSEKQLCSRFVCHWYQNCSTQHQSIHESIYSRFQFSSKKLLWRFVCNFWRFVVFFLKFVPTIYDEPALQVLIGYFYNPANRIAQCSIIVNTRNEVQNEFQNTVINTLKLQTSIRSILEIEIDALLYS